MAALQGNKDTTKTQDLECCSHFLVISECLRGFLSLLYQYYTGKGQNEDTREPLYL